MYFHLIILAFYTVFLACLTANAIYLGHADSSDTSAHFGDNMSLPEVLRTPHLESNFVSTCVGVMSNRKMT